MVAAVEQVLIKPFDVQDLNLKHFQELQRGAFWRPLSIANIKYLLNPHLNPPMLGLTSFPQSIVSICVDLLSRMDGTDHCYTHGGPKALAAVDWVKERGCWPKSTALGKRNIRKHHGF